MFGSGSCQTSREVFLANLLILPLQNSTVNQNPNHTNITQGASGHSHHGWQRAVGRALPALADLNGGRTMHPRHHRLGFAAISLPANFGIMNTCAHIPAAWRS